MKNKALIVAARFGLAASAFLLTYGLRIGLDRWLGDRAVFLLYVLPLLLSALYLGRGPSILVALLAGVAGMLDFWPLGIDVDEWVYLGIFGLVAAGIILLTISNEAVRAFTIRLHDAEEATRNTENVTAELNLLVEGAIDYAILMTDPAGRVTVWNKGAERVLAWKEEEIVGQSFELFYPGKERREGRPAADLRAALEQGGVSAEKWQVRKDGSEFLADVTITPLYGEDREVRSFATLIRDITDRHASERAVEGREKLLQSILDTVPDAMIVIDSRGRIISFSTAAEKMFGYSEQELISTNVSLLMPSPDSERHDGYLHRYLTTGERRIIGIGRTVTGRRKDGTTFPMELSVGEAITDGHRLFTGFVRDLTDKNRTEAQVQQLQSELIHISRFSAMGTMASTLAHELNQPLTAIANYAEAIASVIDDAGPDERAMLKEMFEDMAAQSLRAGRIVRRLREFIARGEVEKRVEDLPALINEAAGLALVGAREKAIVAHIELDPAASPVLVDRVQIQQVLINLIRNAIEAMAENGGGEITIRSVPRDGNAVVSVRDTGPGIDQSVADQLFQAFVSTKGSGMGLGLSICRTIIEAHGGRISANKAPGGGTEFQFTLPMAA
jgi:two-component system sensor kinase FixL